MKKLIVLAVIIALLVSFATTVSADENFKISHSVINESDEYCDININTPYFEGFDGSEELNKLIRDTIIDKLGFVRATGVELKEFDRKTELIIYYDYTKHDDLLSVRLNTYDYLGGAHGSSQIIPMTINTISGNMYKFEDLFNDVNEGIKFIESHILDCIQENSEVYFEEYEQTIKNKDGDFDFYFSGNKLVIFFGQYDIAPHAAGIRYFEFDISKLKGIIKDDIYNSLKKEKVNGNIYFNGVDLNSNNGLIETEDWVVMVPLRDIAESLGYEVDWNKEDGAIVNGDFIKPGISSYLNTESEPIELAEPIINNGVTYVPLEYFTTVLDESVFLSTNNNETMEIKIFDSNGFENNFDKLVKGFYYPNSNENAVRMYAEAIKDRNGAIQYALLSNKLKEEKYEELKSFSFVTGTSSPWINSYEIVETGENAYRIDFTLITSVPGESFTSCIEVIVVEEDGFWKVADIE